MVSCVFSSCDCLYFTHFQCYIVLQWVTEQFINPSPYWEFPTFATVNTFEVNIFMHISECSCARVSTLLCIKVKQFDGRSVYLQPACYSGAFPGGCNNRPSQQQCAFPHFLTHTSVLFCLVDTCDYHFILSVWVFAQNKDSFCSQVQYESLVKEASLGLQRPHPRKWMMESISKEALYWE